MNKEKKETPYKPKKFTILVKLGDNGNVQKVPKLLVWTFVIVVFCTCSIVYTLLLKYTPAKELIPRMMENESSRKTLYKLALKTDSIESVFMQNTVYMNNIRLLLKNGEPLPEMYDSLKSRTSAVSPPKVIAPSIEDSILRKQFEKKWEHSLLSKYRNIQKSLHLNSTETAFSTILFPPLLGRISRSFDMDDHHFGLDIIPRKNNEPIKSILNGIVIFSEWTTESGYVIIIQHFDDLISIYKHNSSLLKSTGDHVNMGETIAIVGESGELSFGVHLHFELWYKGMAINPENYLHY